MRPIIPIAVFGAMCLIGVSQDIETTRKTNITVNETILVPGKELPPGKYVMKLLDVTANRHVVQIFNEDQTQLQATILAFPNERLQPTSDTVLTYWETPAGSPPALRAWFYPGDTLGQEFAYPKEMAERIARANNNAAVPNYQGELKTSEVSSIEVQNAPAAPTTTAAAARVEETPLNTATTQSDSDRSPRVSTEAKQPETTTAETTIAQDRRDRTQTEGTADRSADETLLAQNNPPATNPSATKGGAELPRTASNGPAAMLIALVCIACASLLRFARA